MGTGDQLDGIGGGLTLDEAGLRYRLHVCPGGFCYRKVGHDRHMRKSSSWGRMVCLGSEASGMSTGTETGAYNTKTNPSMLTLEGG